MKKVSQTVTGVLNGEDKADVTYIVKMYQATPDGVYTDPLISKMVSIIC